MKNTNSLLWSKSNKSFNNSKVASFHAKIEQSLKIAQAVLRSFLFMNFVEFIIAFQNGLGQHSICYENIA